MRTINCFRKKMYMKPNWILLKCRVVCVELILVCAVNQKLNKLSNSSFFNGWKWSVRSKLYRNSQGRKPMNDPKTVCQVWTLKRFERKLNMRRNWTEFKKNEAHCWWLWQKIAPHYINVFCVVFHVHERINKKWNF